MSKIHLHICVFLIGLLSLNLGSNVQAASGGSLSFPGSAYDSTKSCGEAEINYSFTVTGTTQDNSGRNTDFVGIILTDANGNTVDVDFGHIDVGATVTRTDTFRAGMNDLSQITKLPLTAKLYEIGDIFTLPETDHGVDENTQSSAAFVRSGTEMASATTDPSVYVPACRTISGASQAPTSPSPTVTPTSNNQTPTSQASPSPTPSTNNSVQSSATASPSPKASIKPKPSPTLKTNALKKAAEATAAATATESATVSAQAEITPEPTPSVDEPQSTKTPILEKIKSFFKRLFRWS